ncbi:MAG: sensor histidine kinase, partial [Candidatus Eremiobacteraeota bacterium]|nr:sensor histidine kinase [Candidatus Eremiobacteraeota bacterium]
GMDPQDVAHAFDRFYRGAARTEAEGSGLGLSIAKIAVERAGGTIAIDSTPGRGTAVSLCLPVVNIS